MDTGTAPNERTQAMHPTIPADLRDTHAALVIAQERADRAFRRVVEGTVRSTSGAAAAAARLENATGDFERACYGAGLEPDAVRAAIAADLADVVAELTPAIGTLIGLVPDGEVLAGWKKIATGDGRYITTKSGVCFGAQHDPTIPSELGWGAVGAYFAGRSL